jgi:hypothetical protein
MTTLDPEIPEVHPLAPIPQRLAKLLVASKDPHLAGRVEKWMARQSDGQYQRLHAWLDDTDNLPLRRSLGTEACEIIESENLARFEEGAT